MKHVRTAFRWPASTLARALAALAFVAVAAAQTTGVPGINDYTISGSSGPNCAGSPSCITCCYPTPTTVTGNVSTVPGNFVIFIWSFCPCSAGFLCGPSNSCIPVIPATACGNSTNQSLDFALGCVNSFFIAGTNTAGQATFTMNVPSLGPACASASLATQAIALDPCGLGIAIAPGPFVFTQAYQINF